MRVKTILAAGALATLALTSAALTSAAMTSSAMAADKDARCTDQPREQWMSKDAAKAKATALGYEVRRVKVEDGCYEIYAFDSNKAKVEIFMNPVSGELVNRKDDD
ncbi:MAG: PepSY domain-containing protein [Parvibaculum sp.]|uniref:PepSY domain-containing protein n=1 Tax=Parvibaculum sp. TaxID=2024848 RepID=UPI003C71AE09